MTPNFDRIARAYRWLEYLSLGPLLERTRNHFLPRLHACTQALILGDGDGRFTARLLAENPHLKADAVDLSAAMLTLLCRRTENWVPHRREARVGSGRLQTHQADARTFTPTDTPGLVVTHFFLDCLTQPEVDALVSRLTPRLNSNALWLVSDFRIPSGPLHWPARLYIRLLYLAFRILTGLRTTRLPDHAAAFARCGFQRIAVHYALCGLLTSELWQRNSSTTPPNSSFRAAGTATPDLLRYPLMSRVTPQFDGPMPDSADRETAATGS